MADVYNREELTYGGSFAADSAKIMFATEHWAGADLDFAIGMLAQNLQFSYVQPVQRFFELGGQNVYYFAGRPQGQGAIGRLAGPRAGFDSFYTTLGDVCNANGNTAVVEANAGCGETVGSQVKWEFRGIILTSISGTVAAEDMIWREQLGFIFYCLSFGDE